MKRTIAFLATIAMFCGGNSVKAASADELDKVKTTLIELADTKNNILDEKDELTRRLEQKTSIIKKQKSKRDDLLLEQAQSIQLIDQLINQLEGRKEAIKQEQSGNQVGEALKNMASLLQDAKYRKRLLTRGLSMDEYILETDELYRTLLAQKEHKIVQRVALTYQLNEQNEVLTDLKLEAKKIQQELKNNQTQLKKLNEDLQKVEKEKTTLEKEIKAAIEKKKRIFHPPLSKLVVTSGFGTRVDPTGFSGTTHDGIDFSGSLNQAVMASKAGLVVKAGFGSSTGNYVIIKHDDGFYTYYMHLNKIETTVDQTVSAGQHIGGMGSTGNSTGIHLHFGIATSADYSGFVNPASYLKLS